MAAGSTVLVGSGDDLITIPEADWWAGLLAHVPAARQRHDALSTLQRAVRRAAVLRVVETGRPVPAETIAADVGAEVPEVVTALADLEARLFFLVRGSSGAVSWSYPVTADTTPHHLIFSTGERLDGA